MKHIKLLFALEKAKVEVTNDPRDRHHWPHFRARCRDKAYVWYRTGSGLARWSNQSPAEARKLKTVEEVVTWLQTWEEKAEASLNVMGWRVVLVQKKGPVPSASLTFGPRSAAPLARVTVPPYEVASVLGMMQDGAAHGLLLDYLRERDDLVAQVLERLGAK